MKRVYSIIFVFFLFASCKSIKSMDNYSETLLFFNDLEPEMCFEKIKNDYWIEEITSNLRNYRSKYLDSIDDDIDGVLSYSPPKTLKIHFDKIIIDHEKTIKDLKLSNNKRMTNFSNCDKRTLLKGWISSPIFNVKKTISIIENSWGTSLYKKDENGKWIYEREILIRQY